MIETLNIFRWATKELSQDAFICWMLSWADPAARQVDKKMHQGGVIFLNALLKLHDENPVNLQCEHPNEGLGVVVYTQVHHTDIIVLVGDKLVLLIEDKTGGKDPVKKLLRGFLAIKEAYYGRQVRPVYFKTGDQGNYKAPIEAGYEIYKRHDLLLDLRKMSDQCKHNTIFTDFLAHMERRECLTRSYERSEVASWGLYAWQGFFMALQDNLQDMDWDIVNPPSGSFMAAYWHYKRWGLWETYIQIEKDLLVMKINFYGDMDRPTRTRARNQWFGILMQAAEGGPISIKRPRNFGVGKSMTAAHIGAKGEWICKDQDRHLDLKATVNYLHMAMKLLDQARELGAQILPESTTQ